MWNQFIIESLKNSEISAKRCLHCTVKLHEGSLRALVVYPLVWRWRVVLAGIDSVNNAATSQRLQGLNIVSPGILGILTRITTNNTPEHGNVCVLVLALSHAKYCNNDCIRQQSWLTHCVSPHYPGGRWLVTSWQWSCVRDSVTRRDANCGNIIYSGHTDCRLRHTAHPRSN